MSRQVPINIFQKEPYRLLFPLAIAASFFGLGVWVIYWLWPVWGYPIKPHVNIQIKGMMLCLFLGYLYTLIPRLFRCPPISRGGLLLLSTCLGGQIVLVGFHNIPLLDVLFLIALGQFCWFWISRKNQFKISIPAKLVTLPWAFAVNFVLSFVLFLSQIGVTVPKGLVNIGYLFQVQGFGLWVILSASTFLLPKLMLTEDGLRQHLQDINLKQNARKKTNGLFFLLFLLSYGIEAFTLLDSFSLKAAVFIRFFVLLIFLSQSIPLFRLPRKRPQFLIWSWISIWCLPLSQACIFFWPVYRVSWDHVFYINGFILLALSIAAKILSGHAADTGLLKKHPKWMLTYGCILTLGMTTRASAFMVKSYNMHLGAAALCVLFSIAIWAVIFLPKALDVPEYMK